MTLMALFGSDDICVFIRALEMILARNVFDQISLSSRLRYNFDKS